MHATHFCLIKMMRKWVSTYSHWQCVTFRWNSINLRDAESSKRRDWERERVRARDRTRKRESKWICLRQVATLKFHKPRICLKCHGAIDRQMDSIQFTRFIKRIKFGSTFLIFLCLQASWCYSHFMHNHTHTHTGLLFPQLPLLRKILQFFFLLREKMKLKKNNHI